MGKLILLFAYNNMKESKLPMYDSEKCYLLHAV